MTWKHPSFAVAKGLSAARLKSELTLPPGRHRRGAGPSAGWSSLVLAIGLTFAGPWARAVDLDANGLSDVFEYVYFGGPVDPDADPDGDGISNAVESMWGSDPTDPRSVGGGAVAELVGSEIRLQWPGMPGKTYRLQASADLQTWTTVAEGPVNSWHEAIAASVRFWRLQVVFEPPSPGAIAFEAWEQALWQAKYGQSPVRTDLDGDGLNDADEFAMGRSPKRKDHPAVGLVVFTPLEP